MDADTKRKAFLRLRRIEGQVQGGQRMLEPEGWERTGTGQEDRGKERLE